MEEEWRPVVTTKNGVLYDYTGLYEVSNVDGKVRNVRTGKLLKPGKSKGYCVVTLSKQGKKQQFKVHRLVAEAFIPNSENKPYVNHINEHKSDNRIENLEWCTASENALHGTCQQRISEAQKGRKRSEETRRKMCGREFSEETRRKISEAKKGHEPTNARKVRCIETKQVFDTVDNALEWCGITGGISACLVGKQKTAGGYTWEYVEES